jgi:peptide-methionine (S)-S-oxide reductase
VHTSSAGYAGGITPNPSYEEVCTGRTGHTEVVMVVYRPEEVSFDELLRVFWETHDPTQGYRQGNDVGTQYRSAIYTTTDGQLDEAKRSSDIYQAELTPLGLGDITTEIAPLGEYYYAEEYHQQYLAKNPHGYDCHANTGIAYPGLDSVAR